MPVVPFDPARARPRGQARPPKLPAPPTSAMPPRAPGTPAGAALPPGAVRPAPPALGAAVDARRVRPARPRRRRPAASALPPRSQPLWSSEPAGGVMMPAHVPPAPPRLAINLSPAAATRALSMLGLGVALSATVATTLTVIAASPGGLPTETPAAIAQLTNWLVSVPWLFVAVVLAASSRVERVVRPDAGPAWATLAFAAAACAAMQVVGRDLVSTWTLVTRAGLIVVATVSLSLAFRQFLAGPSRTVRAQIVGGVFAGLLGGLGPFAMLGRLPGVAGAATFAPHRRAAERRRRAPRPRPRHRHDPRDAGLRPRLPARLQHRARNRGRSPRTRARQRSSSEAATGPREAPRARPAPRTAAELPRHDGRPASVSFM